MHHISVNFAMGRDAKQIFGGNKSSRHRGRQKGYRGGGKNSFDLLFLDTQVFVGAPKKSEGGAKF